MKAEVVREKPLPQPPPIVKEVILHLTPEEFFLLKAMVGRTVGQLPSPELDTMYGKMPGKTTQGHKWVVGTIAFTDFKLEDLKEAAQRIHDPY